MSFQGVERKVIRLNHHGRRRRRKRRREGMKAGVCVCIVGI